ncbi:DUF4350 domain-containing protein [Halorientalis marina]|uniref:DUF4350 domain-containing protein n=1 Tax=Halorientalis marina TaxID=2931976 RepID=UPI001FF26B1C|nr:DUF4350 domain-containing protein [Halorientalis marina]
MTSDSLVDNHGRVLVYALAIMLALTLVFAASTSGTAFGAYNARWDGSATLRTVADQQDTDVRIARNTTTYQSMGANGTIAFILAPTTPYSDRDVTRLRTFAQRGGTLVVADDPVSTGADSRLLAALGVSARIDNATLRDEQHNYRSPAMPVAQNVTNHTFTRGVESLTLNYGTAVRPGNGTVLVRTSEFGYLDRDGSASITGNETLARYPVVTAESLGNGTVVTVSDPSVFINAMLERPGNRQFARTLLTTHQRLLLDYSHGGTVPPLVAALLTVRQSPLLQVSLGLSGLLLIVGWRRNAFARLPDGVDSIQTSERAARTEIEVDADDIVAHLRREHPDWDDDRIRRIADSALRDRQK